MRRRGLLVALALLSVVGAPGRASACDPGCALAPFPPRYRDAEPFEQAIAAADRTSGPARAVSGLTVSHHLLAADLIARAFREVGPDRIDKVVVLFPDHFKKTRLPFATTRRDFETVFGRVRTRRSDAEALLALTDLVEDSRLFARDHGIGAVLPFIRHYLPDAEIVPVAVSIGSRREEWDRLAERLAAMVDAGTLIVQSTDFSHYLPPAEAARRDQETLNVLAAGDLDAAARLSQPGHTDSRGAQYIQIKVQAEVFHARPVVLSNVNSQAYSDVPQRRTTSYTIQIYEPQPPARIGADLEGSRVYCLAGDTFFGRHVARALADAAAAERVRAEMAAFLNGCRLVLNLEGVMRAAVPEGLGPTRLAMPEALTIRWLRALGAVAVGVANNHARDFGGRPTPAWCAACAGPASRSWSTAAASISAGCASPA